MRKVNLLKAVVASVTLVALISSSTVLAKTTAATAYVNQNIKIKVNNKVVTLKDPNGSKLYPVIVYGRTFLPARCMAQALGADIKWDASTKTILLSNNSSSASNNSMTNKEDATETSSALPVALKPIDACTNDDIKIKVNDEAFIPKDVDGTIFKPVIINGFVYLPSESIAKALDAEFNWNISSQTILFTQKVDLGGKTITIAYDNNATVSPGEPATPVELETNPNLIVKYNTIENAKKRMNFNIDWKYRSPDNMVNEYMEACAAGTKYADIMLSSTKRVFPKLAVSNLLVPMQNYIDFAKDPVYKMGTVSTGTDFLGTKWGLVDKPYKVGYVVFYNKTIFKKEGFTDLQELYKNGSWTWDTMLDYAKKAVHDTNGDGKPEEYGLILSDLSAGVQALALSNGADFISYDSEKNTYKFAASDAKAYKALQLMDNLIKNKLTSPSSGVKFDKNPVAMLIGKSLTDGASYLKAGMDYGVAPLPKGPDVSETQFADGNGADAYFIPKNTDSDVSAAIIKEAFTYWNPDKPDHMNERDVLYVDLKKSLATEADINWTVDNFKSPFISHLKSFSTFKSNLGKNLVNPVGWETSTLEDAFTKYSESLQNDVASALQIEATK